MSYPSPWRTQPWLRQLERRLQFLAIPNIGILLVTLQVAGFILVTLDRAWMERLALLPAEVLGGAQYWRVLTYLAVPVSMNPLWALLSCWFLYTMMGVLEAQWGALRATLYTLSSMLTTVIFSLWSGYPVTSASDFQFTLILAMATLFPEMEVRLYFVIPAKMKWLAYLSVVVIGLWLLYGSWLDRLYYLAVYSNYLLFFAPVGLRNVRQFFRRRRFRRDFRPPS